MDIRDYLTRIKSDAESALSLLPPAPPSGTETVVKAGGNLQAALDAGGIVHLEAGAVFSGNFVASRAGLRLIGASGSELRGLAGGPALFVPPGAKDIQLGAFRAFTAWDQAVILLGLNDPVQSVADAPAGLIISNVQVPSHRGKRAFELNCADTVLLDCGCADVFDPAVRDSQAIWVGNAPGKISVNGGTFSAGSEIILIGGGEDTQASKVVPTGLEFVNLKLRRPLSWRGDGVNRKVKTTFEVKTGHAITLAQSMIDGVWKDGQDGYAITVTPRDGGDIADVLIDRCTIRNAGSGLNLLGHDNEGYSPQAKRIVLSGVDCLIADKTLGVGRFVQMGGEPFGFELRSCSFDGPDSIVLSYAARAWDSPTLSHQGYVARGTKLLGNKFVSRSWGLMLEGAAGAGAYGRFWKEAWPDGVISGNAFSGPTALNHKPNLPADNTFSA